MTHLYGSPMRAKQSLWLELTKIKGIGRKTSLEICQALGIEPTCSWNQLTEIQKREINRWMDLHIAKDKKIGKELIRAQQQKKSELIALANYRGIRHRLGLPVRGQRTHTNARTARKLKV
jgi:small subunit ribosomal protein S13